MGREYFLDGTDWLVRSRRRRLRIGDLMIAIAITALGLAAISLADFTPGARNLVATVTLGLLALQWTQWALASVQVNQSHPGKMLLLGILSSFAALAMLLALIVLGLVFPQGTALLTVMILIQVVYLTTWD